jgi:hypothetical protein
MLLDQDRGIAAEKGETVSQAMLIEAETGS